MSTPPPLPPPSGRPPEDGPPQDGPSEYGPPAFQHDDGLAPPPAYEPPAYHWDQQSAQGPQPSSRRNGLAIASLVLGVLSIVTGLFLIGGLFGLIGVILGFLGRRTAKRGEAGDAGIALAGIITSILGMLIAIGVAVLSGFLLTSESFQNLTECLSAAGEDEAAIEQCVEDFQPGN